ncbi:MAG: hypothetical protein NT018_12905 [Armatimonadetes bacterium]|nr:hypothetical protein [Armatimonadota bacterium]
MKLIKICSMLSALAFTLMLSSLSTAAEQPKDPWKQLVSASIKDIVVTEAVSTLLKGSQISYTFCSQGNWPKVIANFNEVPVDVALRQLLQTVKVPYRIEGTTVLIAANRIDLPVQSVKLRIVTTASFTAMGRKPVKITMDTTNTGAEGSPMAVQSTGGGSVFEAPQNVPVTYTMSAQLMPLLMNIGQPSGNRLSLTGSVSLNLQIPYYESVSTVVGPNVVTQDVPRFINATKNFAVGMAVPLDTPTVIAEQTESTDTGKTTYTITLTASLSKEAVVMTPSGAARSGNLTWSYAEPKPMTIGEPNMVYTH